MILYRAHCLIRQGSDTLLEFSDLIQGKVKLVMEPTIQESGFAGGEGFRTWDRGNRKHVLSFVRWRDYGSVRAALVAKFMGAKNAPVGGRDVTIRVEGYDGYQTLFAASVVTWNSELPEGYETFVRTEVVIRGGALSGTMSTGVERRIVGQDGGVILDQGGGTIREQ